MDLEGVPWVSWNSSFEGLPLKVLCANVRSHTGTSLFKILLWLGMAIYYISVSGECLFSCVFADNQLLCSLDVRPEASSNTTTIGLAVGRLTFAISPKIMIYEGQKSEIFRRGEGGVGIPLDLAGVLSML